MIESLTSQKIKSSRESLRPFNLVTRTLDKCWKPRKNAWMGGWGGEDLVSQIEDNREIWGRSKSASYLRTVQQRVSTNMATNLASLWHSIVEWLPFYKMLTKVWKASWWGEQIQSVSGHAEWRSSVPLYLVLQVDRRLSNPVEIKMIHCYTVSK